MSNTIAVQILGEASQLRGELNKANGYLGGFQKTAGKVGSVLKGVFAAAVITKGLRAIKGFAKDAIGEAREAQKVGAVTARVIKATGGASKVTAAQVSDLATAISTKTGVDDEAIQKGSNLLLTFKKVRNEAGKGSDMFNRATRAAVDLSKTGFGSIEGSSKMLGKALNDPIKGISALSRAGVTFSEDQKKAIKKMVETGDVLGAQKIIMKEVESQVGGVAAAQATAGEKAKVAWGNFKEAVGTQALPILDKLLGFLAGKLIPKLTSLAQTYGPKVIAFFKGAADWASRFLSGLKGDGTLAQYFETARGVLGTVLGILRDIAAAIIANWPAIKAAITSALSAIQAGFQALKQFWDAWGPTISTVIGNAFTTAVKVISAALQVISGVVKLWTSIFSGDWRGALQGIGQITSGVWSAIKAIFANVLEQIHAVVRKFLPQLPATFRETFDQVKAKVQAVMTFVQTWIRSKISAARSSISNGLGAIRATWSAAWSSLRQRLSEAWSAIVRTVTDRAASVRTRISSLRSRIIGIFSGAAGWLRAAGRRIIQGLLDGINSMIGWVRSALSTLTNLIPSWKGPASRDAKLLFEAGQLIMQSLVNGFEAGESGVKAQLQSITRFIGSALDGVMSPTLSPTVDLRGMNASLGDLGSNGAGSVTNLSVTLHVQPGATGVQVGADFVRFVREYEQATGRKVLVS